MLFIAMSIAMNACSADTADGIEDTTSAGTGKKVVTEFSYNDSELETMQLINEYRLSVGKKALQKINHISFKCEEHNDYMITNNLVNHDGFVDRSDNLIEVLGAKRVGENVAYNYKTSPAVVKAWLDSPSHKENIEGDYTHFGLSVKTDANGKKYYTNIFIKI
jgi:uncharacterized protein YkwD